MDFSRELSTVGDHGDWHVFCSVSHHEGMLPICGGPVPCILTLRETAVLASIAIGSSNQVDVCLILAAHVYKPNASQTSRFGYRETGGGSRVGYTFCWSVNDSPLKDLCPSMNGIKQSSSSHRLQLHALSWFVMAVARTAHVAEGSLPGNVADIYLCGQT